MKKYICYLLFSFFWISSAQAQYVNLSSDFKESLNPVSSVNISQSPNGLYYRYTVMDYGILGQKVKMFVPPGAVQITSSILSVSPIRAVWRWGQVPTVMASSVSGEKLAPYGARLLDSLQSKGDVIFSIDNPGYLTMDAGTGGLSNALQVGGYAFVDLGYSAPPVFTTSFLIDKVCYDNWFYSSSTKWIGNSPDPTAVHTCSGSTGGVTLTSIALNPSFLQYTLGAQQQQSVQVTAVPPNAPLTDCKFSAISINASITPGGAVSLLDGARQLAQDEKLTVSCGQVTADLTIKAVSSATVSLESISVANNLQPNATLSTLIRPNPISASLGKCSVFPESYVTVQDNSITLNAAANQITSDQDVEVACSGKKVTFKILKPVEELTKVQVVESSDSSGNLSLLLSMTRSPVVLSTVKPVDVWIAAKVTASFGINETWYFLVGSPSVSWSPFNAGANDFAFLLSEWGRVTYKGSGDLKTDTQIQTLTVGLGFKKEQLLTAGVELWVAEQVEGRGRVMLGKVWPK